MLFYFLFVGFQFMPWYMAWLAAPAALLTAPEDTARRRMVFALCAAAPLIYFPFGWQWARDTLGAAAVAALSALPLVGILGWRVLSRLRRRQ
jgi:hypothetical protein